MADIDSCSETPPPQLVSQNQKNPSKFNSHFVYKVVSIAIVLVVLPLFPSQAPDFINQTIFTRSWELLHLLFVGIAVSYGLFSRRNVDTENENQLKVDSTQTYVSRILQVSSVFEDELDTPFFSDENKAQTWNSKYYRGNPVVVEQESPVLDEHNATVSSVVNKPLLLPVRSLRSSVSGSDSVDSVHESIDSLGSSISRSSSDKIRSRGFEDLGSLDLEEKLQESVVLPSPIPWRSRSGRMEMREEAGDVNANVNVNVNPPPYSLPPSVDETDFDPREIRSFPSPVHRSSKSNSSNSSHSASPSPKRLSPTLSPEMKAKSIEDLGRKKNNAYKSSPPPPPPPPLPTSVSRKSRSTLSNSHSMNDGFPPEKKVVKRSSSDDMKDISKGGKEDFSRGTEFVIDGMKSEARQKSNSEASSMGKSVRTIRGSEPNAEVKKYREFEERPNGKPEKRYNEVDREFVDKPRRKTVGFSQTSMSHEYQPDEIPRSSLKPTLPKYQKKQKKKLAQKVIVETEEYSSSDADDIQESSDIEEVVSDSVSNAGSDPNEVDKKADEFIAKFREQIRLQRIESIKRSSGQRR